jgi:hypothetical protein
VICTPAFASIFLLVVFLTGNLIDVKLVMQLVITE